MNDPPVFHNRSQGVVMTDVSTDILVCATWTHHGMVELLRSAGTVWTTFVHLTATFYEIWLWWMPGMR